MSGDRALPTGAGRRGFTLVELLLVMLMLAILSTLAMPRLNRAMTNARAAEAVGDLNAVRVGLLQFVGDNHTWPDDTGPGEIPTGLADFLPPEFSFSTEHYDIDYDNSGTSPGGYIGLTLSTSDANLGLAMVDLLGANTWTNGTDRFTWVVEWGTG